MTNNNLIPFSKELWETGEYEAVTRDSVGIAIIYEIDRNIYGRLGGSACDWRPNGQIHVDVENEDDLMLRKKTKKVWVGLFKTDGFYDTKEECESETKFLDGFIKAIEVEI